MRKVFLMMVIVASASAQAQTQLEVGPSATHKSIQQIKGVHQAFWNSKFPQGDALLVSLGGTNSIPSDLNAFNKLAALNGYDVIAIDYDNHVITTTCKESKDSRCFDHFRQEVVTGKSVSPLIKVNTVNSIEKRIEHLIKYLIQKDSARWSAYLKNDKVDWSNVVVAGHSQGSGHAAYLAKLHSLRGAILLAGPQDRFEDGRKVEWLRLPSKTKPDRYFALLHKDDFFGSEYQTYNLLLLRESHQATTQVVLATDKVKDAHMAVIQPQFQSVWKNLLRQALSPH